MPASTPEDETTRSPSKAQGASEILNLAWPVMGSQVLLNLTGLVDRMMIGRLGEAGSSAVPLAAVGYASQLFFLVHSTLIAVGLACVALMARAIGGGRSKQAREAFAASVQISMLVTAAYSAVIFVGDTFILRALGAEDTVVALATPYLHLQLVAALMLSVSLMMESALRADRNPRTPMQIAIVVTAVKLGLNGILIFGLWGFPRLELVGAGVATVVSQAIGLLLFVVYLARKPADAPTALRPALVWRASNETRDVIRISVPSILERIVLNMGLLSYFWILSRWYGTVAVAAYTVGISLLSFSWIPGTGYAQACATLVGQALGAHRPDEALRTGQRTIALAVGTAVPLGILCGLFRIPLARLFTEDASVISTLGPFMLALAFSQPFLQLHFTLAGAHKGAGDTTTPLVAALFGNWMLRIPLAILIAGVLELSLGWVWLALITDHVGRSILLGISFVRGRWREPRSPAARAGA